MPLFTRPAMLKNNFQAMCNGTRAVAERQPMANDLVVAEQKPGGRHKFAVGNKYGKGRKVGSQVKLSESFYRALRLISPNMAKT